jgi:hypothetical protein
VLYWFSYWYCWHVSLISGPMQRPVQTYTTTVHAFTSLVNFFYAFVPRCPGDVLDPSLNFLPCGLVEGQVSISVGSWTPAGSLTECFSVECTPTG